MTVDLFANNAYATVTSGGADAPVAGTVQTWTLDNMVNLPAVTTAGGNQFRAIDPAAPSEVILVTDITGSTATVVRGGEGTLPVTHTSGFTIRHGFTAGKAAQWETDALAWETFSAVTWPAHLAAPSGPTVVAWTDYAVTWSASGTAPVVGNGTLTGSYMMIGDLVFCRVGLAFGSTTTFGTGSSYSFSLPVPALYSSAVNEFLGSGYIKDSSATNYYALVCRTNSGSTIVGRLTSTNGTTAGYTLGPTSPITFASGDEVNLTLSYVAA